jgi:PAS domain S-box-containing protein
MTPGLSQRTGLAHMAVLVVDDDDVDRERVMRFLRCSPFDIAATEAASGAQAILFVRDKKFDCIVLDNHLGDSMGSEILPALKRESQQACPVIMVTGAGDEQLAVRMLQGGAADYLPKRDLNADVLIHSICRCLEQQRLRDELAETQRLLEHSVRAQALTIEQRERDLKSILDHMPALIGYWDSSRHNRFGNRAYEEWFGVTLERMPGMHARDVLGKAGRQLAAAHVEGALRGEAQFFEYATPARASRSTHHCQAHFIPDCGSDGGVAGFYSFVVDVTALKEAQARADELAAFNETVVQSSPIGIAVYHADGRCILANAALVESVSGNRLNLLQQNFHRLRWWQESGLLQEAESTLRDGRPRGCEAHATGSSGREIWLECGLTAIDHQGERCLLLIAHDVTAQREARSELAAARDGANAASRAKGDFLANMSHEIRTPMNAIIGLSRLALEDDMPPRARDFVDKVHSSALALMGILDDVLDYSKIEAGQLQFESIEFELEELLQRVSDLFAVRIEQKGLEFVFEVLPEVPARLVGDSLRLSQVLCNFIGNAVKFTEQGEILVRVQLIESLEGSTCRLRFSVQDTGIGISPVNQSLLFEPFTQADGSITRRFGGTGLGLAISKRLVQRMDGEIAVASAPGSGSDFSFTVRIASALASATTIDRSEVAGLRVLVVDDNAVCRRVLVNELAALEIHAIAAGCGLAALRRVERAQRQGRPFDLVILDWNMPGMDGVRTLHRLHEQALRHRRHPAPVMMMVPTIGREALLAEAGAIRPDHVLAKPVIRSQLQDALLHMRRGTQSSASTGPPTFEALRAQATRLIGARVLLAEDNPVNQLMLGELLKMLGIEVVVVSDGAEAVEAVRVGEAGRFDVVLMDLHMPRMDGFEAARRIHAMPHSLQTPVIAMTAAVLPVDRVQSLAAGMVDHVAKPILVERLLEVLLKWVPKRNGKACT